MKLKAQGEKRVSRPNAQMLRRTLFLMAVCGIFAFALLLGRLYKLQITDHEFYEDLARSQQLREHKSSAGRGSIYDRNMEILAVSAPVQSLYFAPSEIKEEQRAELCRSLSELLSLDYDSLYKKSGEKGSYYVAVKKKLSPEETESVRKLKAEKNFKGLRLEPDSLRIYPNERLLCHVLGFTGSDNQGLEGIEAQYEKNLAGSPGKSYRLTNAYGTELLFDSYESRSPETEGCSLVLSIDSHIQYFVEKQLRQAVEDYKIQNGAGAIAMNVNTGAILAMASLNDYDPNNFLDIGEDGENKLLDLEGEERAEALKKARLSQWRNKALCDSYEPGSTFKIITLAAALEEGAADLDSRYYCGGSVSVRGRTSPIRCWKHGGHGSQNLQQAVQHSCNAAFVNIGLSIGAERFYDYLEAFGFIEKTGNRDENLSCKTGIDLHGESGSIFWSENVFCSEKNQSQLAAASFGQTFTISPLQLITAVSACVNGGHLMEPYVVEKQLKPDGSLAFIKEPREIRQVISEDTSRKVREILESVVGDEKEGTGRNAAVSGYRIGGKTGTSEKVSLEAATGKKEYIVSFIGFAPADEPEIALLVFLDTPADDSGVYVSGGQMAAPTVGKMFADILPYMGYTPREDEGFNAEVPELTGMSINAAKKLAEDAGLGCRVMGEGETVTFQLPKAQSFIAKNSEIIIYTDKSPSNAERVLPDMRDWDYNTTIGYLQDMGVFVKSLSPVNPSGAQKILSQSLPAGAKIPPGTVIELMLRDSGDELLGKY